MSNVYREHLPCNRRGKQRQHRRVSRRHRLGLVVRRQHHDHGKRGRRVPVRVLFEYLEGGYTVTQFMSDFEGVDAAQVSGVLDLASKGLRETLLGESERGAA